MNVLEKLMEVQQTLKAPKGQYNDFGKYRYRSCEDILEEVKPILKKVKAIILLSDAIDVKADMPYCISTATFRDIESNEYIEVHAGAREPFERKGMDASQISGATSSYSRKYALNGLLLIDDNKDADSTNTHGNEGKPVKDVKRNVSKVEPLKEDLF